MGGSFKDVPRIIQQAFDHLNPGGWIEWQEYEMTVKSDDDSLPPNSAMARWTAIVNKAAEKYGKEINIAPKLKSLMEISGFVNVSDKIYKVGKLPRLEGMSLNFELRADLKYMLLLGSCNTLAKGPQT